MTMYLLTLQAGTCSKGFTSSNYTTIRATSAPISPHSDILQNNIADEASLYECVTRHLPTYAGGLVNMFHSCTPENLKNMIAEDMDNKDGNIRLLIIDTNAAIKVFIWL